MSTYGENNPPFPHLCIHCRYHQLRAKQQPFSTFALQTPGGLKAKLEWDEKQRQRAQQERQRVEAGLPFDYEPHHYAWCLAYTYINEQDMRRIEVVIETGGWAQARVLVQESVQRGREVVRHARAGDERALGELAQSGQATMNPVTGEIRQIYELCGVKNPEAQCPLFDPKGS